MTERFSPAAAPVVAGDGLAWVQQRPARGVAVVASDAAGAKRELLALRTSLEPPRDASFGVRLAADDPLVAADVAESVYQGGRAPPGTVQRSVWVGRVDGSLERSTGPCADDPYWHPAPGIALSGTRLAGVGPGCGQRGVRDLATGGSVALPPLSRSYVQAGDFTAWIEPNDRGGQDAMVLDIATGASYRLSGVPGGPLALDADGTLVLAAYGRPGRPGQRIHWASPESPRLRRVPGTFGGISPIAVRGGRVVFVEHPALDGPTGFNGELRVLDLAGGGRTWTAGSGLSGRYDTLGFDGRRVAVWANRCGRAELIAAPLGSPALHVRQPRRCPLRLRERPKLYRTELNTYLQVSISCLGYLRRCGASELRATTPDGRRLLARREAQDAGKARLRLTAAGRRALRGGGLRRIRLSARMSDDGFGSDPAAQRLHSGLARAPIASRP